MARLRQFVQLVVMTTAFLLVVVLFSRAFVALYRLVQRMVEKLGVEELLDYTLATVLVILLLVLLFFITGRRVVVKSEKSGIVPSVDSQNVLVYVNGGWQPALLIERNATGAYVVYVPHVPNARSGAVYVVESFQVTPLNIPTREMEAIIRHAGKGLSDYTGKLFETG